MKTFNWPVRPNVKESAEPQVNVIKFGDGYEQRQAKGINNNLRTYDVELKVINEEAILIDNFFSFHGAIKPFLWREPKLNHFIKVKCTKWSSIVDYKVTTISATFEEIVA